jgi:hypothetical protein
VTHFEENKKNLDEKDQRIEELIAVSYLPSFIVLVKCG